jgi:uncharacterized membrane protein YecN with MAPEG domain
VNSEGNFAGPEERGKSMTIPVTALVAAICAVLLLLTAIDTVRQRMRLRVAFGDGNDPKLISAARSHANLAEHAPIVILMMGALELARANHWGLVGVGAIFLVGRILHIIGLYQPMSETPPMARSIGVMATWLTLAVLAGWTLWLLATVNL